MCMLSPKALFNRWAGCVMHVLDRENRNEARYGLLFLSANLGFVTKTIGSSLGCAHFHDAIFGGVSHPLEHYHRGPWIHADHSSGGGINDIGGQGFLSAHYRYTVSIEHHCIEEVRYVDTFIFQPRHHGGWPP